MCCDAGGRHGAGVVRHSVAALLAFVWCVVVAAVLALGASCATAHVAYADETGSITLVCHFDDELLTGDTYTATRVADATVKGVPLFHMRRDRSLLHVAPSGKTLLRRN